MRSAPATFAWWLGGLWIVSMAGVTAVAEAGPRFGLEVSGAMTRVAYQPGYPFAGDAPGWQPEAGFGVTAEWAMAPRASLASGLRYVRFGEHVHQVSDQVVGGVGFTTTLDASQRWHWLAVPVTARLWPLGESPLFFDLGVETRYLIAASSRIEATVTPAGPSPAGIQRSASAIIYDDIPLGEWFDATDDYHRWDLALQGGIGYRFGGPDRRWAARAIYSHGLADIVRRYEGYDGHTRLAELTLGWSW